MVFQRTNVSLKNVNRELKGLKNKMQLNISLYSHILVRKQFKAEKKTVRYKTKMIKTTESLQTALALLKLFIKNLVDPPSEATQASSTQVMLLPKQHIRLQRPLSVPFVMCSTSG